MSREPRMTPMPSTMQGGWCSIGWIPSIAYASNGTMYSAALVFGRATHRT